ncbi:MAG: kelch repeat-containing protein [Gemmatimonadaceae bacterium]
MRRIAVMLLLLSACGGSDTPPIVQPPVVAVSVALPPTAVTAGSTYQFIATVTGTTNATVIWSVDPIGNTNVGVISATGLYAVPNFAGRFTIRATSVADPSKSGSATILVTAAPISVAVVPATLTVGAGGSVQLTATVTGSMNTGVTWDLPGGATTGAVVGTGAANATYTAPATLGVYQVRATSTQDPAKTAAASITVSAGTGFRISGATRVAPGTSTQFVASFNDVATPVTWTFDGAANGSTISTSGVFTAGTTLSTVTLRATDAQGRTTTAPVNVATQVTLDILVPANPTLTTADMLTFYWSVSPTGVSPDVTWSVNPLNGITTPVDYFRGFIPTATPGVVTLTATSVADPTVSKSFVATVTASPGRTFVATAGLPQSPRYDHAAATLSDGRVVLIGGQRSRGVYTALATTDIFDPTTGAFTNGPALKSTRIKSEAIAIDANRVLVTGGVEDYNLAYNTAEIVNVSTGASTVAANAMSVRRLLHQLVPITTGSNAGKIAVLGGFNGPIPYGVPVWQSTTSVELFDPATNRFSTYSASMKSARGQFTATPLLDGRILIVGGYDAGAFAPLASAEIFDPVAGTFTFTGSMSRARSGHTATRLANGFVLIVGGSNNGTDGTTAELYNPTTGQFESVNGSMLVSRTNHAAALLDDGRVAIIGGESGENFVRGSVEAYDPITRTFSSLGHMNSARRRPTASVIVGGIHAGHILVFGGGAEDKVSLATEIVRP